MRAEPRPVTTLRIGSRLLRMERPLVMGIMNVTPDSFYAASRSYEAGRLEQRVMQLKEEGADIVDIGGYSTRPGAAEVTADEEYTRVARGLEAVRRLWPEAVVSVDTFRAGVAEKVIRDWHAEIINDISGGDLDPEMWPVVADMHVAYVLMHTRGTPQNMQHLTDYNDVAAEVLADLLFKADRLKQMGVADIILDPGFGFAKTVEQNFELLAALDVMRRAGYPILAGLSHKSMIWKTLDITADEAETGTVVLDTIALLQGADIIRVHNVKNASQTISLLQTMLNAQCSMLNERNERAAR